MGEELNTAIDELTTKVDKAESDVTLLKQEIAELQKDLAELAKLQKEMDEIRAEEKAAFKKHKNDVTDGIDGVRRALDVLREHYGSGAAFLQVEQSSKVKGIASPPVNPGIVPDNTLPSVNP